MSLDDSELFWTRREKGIANKEEIDKYIRKLEKENRTLKKCVSDIFNGEQETSFTSKQMCYTEKNYISKSDIQKKIDYYYAIDNPVGARVLEKLLEEL